MAEKIIPVDPIFAALLDFHCTNCRASDFDNQSQLLAIEYKKKPQRRKRDKL